MRFDILTLFPHIFETVLNESIIGKAIQNNIIEINPLNIRDFSEDKHRRVDDYPYGGGGGMIMSPQPIYNAYCHIVKNLAHKPRVIYMSPQGKVLDQKLVKDLSNEKHLILLCGHYEGVDERIIEEIVDEEVSIGDYVLTGGELPAMVLIDAVSRLLDGVLSNEDSYKDESHYDGSLEYPQYTRPFEFNNKKVPEILISGHHANIKKWRRMESLKRTYLKRRDLFDKLKLDKEDRFLMGKILSKD